MKIFVSWSKEPSKTIAEELKHFFAMTLGNVQVWMSEVDIQKGKRWGDQIAAELDATKVGIIVCTAGNVREPWIHFEAGALAKTHDSLVHPICFGIEKKDLQGALSLFQATVFEREDMLDLLQQLNSENAVPLKSSDLEARFQRAWPQLIEKVSAAIASHPAASKEPKAPAASVSLSDAMAAVRSGAARAGSGKTSVITLSASPLNQLPERPVDQRPWAVPKTSTGDSESWRDSRLSDDERGILRAVAGHGGTLALMTAEQVTGLTSVRFLHFAESLDRQGYLKLKIGTTRMYSSVELTSEGRRLAVANNWDR